MLKAFSSDLSESYLKSREKIKLSEVRALQKFKVLIIPGVLAESFISDSTNQIKLTFLFEDAFKEQIKVLQTLKIDYQFMALETENSPKQNARAIIEAVLNSEKPVLIYSHSKGGLDVLEAIRQNPAVLANIHGWASVQSPFWGAPVASGFSQNILLRSNSQNLFEWMGGSAAGMNSLTKSEREAYMNDPEVKKIIIEINKKIHFINFASFKTNVFGIDTPLELFRNYTDLKEGSNDGVVPLTSALMKEHGYDINFIIESEVDHLMTMTKYRLESIDYNQKKHTLAVLKLLL